jgi:hypothetical protein
LFQCQPASQPTGFLYSYFIFARKKNKKNKKEIKWCHVGASSSQIHIYKTQEFRSKNKNQVILYVRKSQKGDKPNNNNNNKSQRVEKPKIIIIIKSQRVESKSET